MKISDGERKLLEIANRGLRDSVDMAKNYALRVTINKEDMISEEKIHEWYSEINIELTKYQNLVDHLKKSN